MFCRNCGAKLPDGAKFCGKCGEKLLAIPVEDRTSAKKTSGEQKPRSTTAGKGKVKKILFPLALVLAVVLAVPVAWLFFGSKTVYLQTESVRTTDKQKITIEYEYDEEGNLLSYDNNQKYIVPSDTVRGSHIAWEYEYEDGRIVEAKYYLMDSERLEVEYVYDSNGVLEALELGNLEAEVTCDEEGRILEVDFWDDDFYVEFSYYPNGCMEEMDYANNQFRVHCNYNEEGKQVEYTNYINGMKRYSLEYEYNDDGQLQKMVQQTLYNREVETEQTRLYTYDKKGELIGFEVEMIADEQKITISCEVETDGTVTEYIITDISGDPEEMGYDLDEGDVWHRFEYDEHGNLVKSETFGQGKDKTEYEYIAIKVPRNHEILSKDAPIYLQFLDDMF